MRPKLVVTRQMTPAVQRRIAAEYDAPYPGDRDLTLDETFEVVGRTGTSALMVSSNLKFTPEVIARLPPALRILATASAGFEHIDVAAARARGLIATNTPEVLSDCTADLAMLLILAACRRAHEYNDLMRRGWDRAFGLGEMLGVRVSGRRLGIIGMGSIGRAVARRARGFGMPVLYNNRHRLPPELEGDATWFEDLRAMLPHCQVLSLHAPATPETVGLMNAELFGLLPEGAVFVNTARGSLVDEEALIAALRSGRLGAAGLDVFAREPGFDRRLAVLSNVFLTPHMGSATIETRDAMGFRALDNVAAVLAGGAPLDPLWR